MAQIVIFAAIGDGLQVFRVPAVGDADTGDLALLCHIYCLLFFYNGIVGKLIPGDPVFAGFSALYSVNMSVMLFAGLLTLLICVILVKKSEEVSYSVLDKVGIVLNFIGVFAVLPIISLAACLIQAYPTGPDWIYQAYLCVPPIIVFSIAASVALRRKGFGKSGFFVQFLGIIVEVILAVLEYAL